MTKSQKEFVVKSYAQYFGRAADADKIKYYGVKDNGKAEKASEVLNNIIADAGVYKGDISDKQVVNEAFQNLFGRDAYTTEMNKYIKFVEKGKDLPIKSIVKSAAKTDKAVYNNKMAVAVKYEELGGKGDLDLSKISRGNLIDLKTVFTLSDLQTQYDALPENSGVPSTIDGKTETLTINMDTLKGTAKNDLFLATQKSYWSVADSIDGGKGVDRLKIIDNNNVAFDQDDLEPISATIKNVEIIDIINNNTITVDTTSIDDVTDLYTTSAGANDSTAAATTNINATATAGKIDVNGGKDVTVVSKANVSNDIIVGGTTAAAGTVTTVINDGYVDTAAGIAATTTLGNTTINGGTKINASSKVEFTAAQITAAKTITTANQDTVAQGSVIVNGNASTTEVTVSQTAAQAKIGYAPAVPGVSPVVDGQIEITAGAVNINDVNKGDSTKAGTIETVTVKNAGAVDVDSGALKTLNLEGIITSVDATSTGSKATVDTLALNLNGVDMSGTAAIDTDVKTLNIKSSTTASTIGTTTTDATAINISGDAKLTLTTLTLGATAGNEVITVTNTAGVTIGNALATDVTFTGGAGADSVILSGTYTKAINMGAGDDTVVYAAAGAGGSLNGGAGNDTLVVSAASAIAGLPEVSGFEILRAKGGTSATHNAHTFKALEVGTNTTATTFTNVAAGVGLTVLEANTGVTTTVTLANATGTADVFNLTLSNATAATQAAGTVTIAGVETIKITTVDAGKGADVAATVDSIILAAADATSIVVTGNNGLDFTGSTTLTKVTNFDASAVVGNDTTDTAAGLAVAFASANNLFGSSVSIKGGAGNDILTGTITANDTIIGGAGNDTLNYTGGKDILTGGAGDDTFVINNSASAVGITSYGVNTKVDYATITDLTKGDKIDVSGVTGTAAADAALGAKVTLGAAATFDNYLDAAAVANSGATQSILKWFQFENNTYLVVDDSNNTAFTDGIDAVIKITGLVDLSTSASATDIITIA